jgi:hypothetical protein
MAEGRLPTGVIFLLIYQWFVVLVSLGLTIFVGSVFTLEYTRDGAIGCILLVVPSCLGTAMAIASIQIITHRSRGFLFSMICHAVLEVIGWSVVLLLLGTRAYVQATDGDRQNRGMAIIYVVFAFMVLPLNLPSAWAFFYLRRQRKNSEG